MRIIGIALAATLLLGMAGVTFVMWTDYAYRKGVEAGIYQCEYGDAGQVN